MEEPQAEEIFEQVERNRERLREWLPWVDGTKSPDNVRHFIRTALQQFGENNAFHAGIWYEGHYVGAAGFHKIDWLNKKVELGYWIAQGFEGRGFVGLACRQLCNYAFGTLGLNRVEIHCATGNLRSNRIPQRLGFHLDGTMRGAQLLYGKFHDLNYYGMLAAEWNEADNAGR